ncbi:MAG: hypothetical protein ACRC4T_25440, partial [Cetobacterium sp.]
MELIRERESLICKETNKKYSIKIFRTYYPKRYKINFLDKKLRKEIYNFKNGISFEKFLIEVRDWFIEEYGDYQLNRTIFLPIPASNKKI